MRWRWAEIGGAGGTLAAYLASALPPARRELRRWRAEAARIPDPELRRTALAALGGKAINVEAVAVFATLAPPRGRRRAVRAIAALQVATDYLDSLTEPPAAAPDPLADSLRLHRALAAAVTPGAPPEDWYSLHPRGEDGGYLDRLVAACQDALRGLPAEAAAGPALRRAAHRCGEGQSRTHAGGLRGWAEGLPPDGYRWWEKAAGASSSVAAQALIAAAADPRTDTAEAERIEAAYHPALGALTVLLDDLVDRAADSAAGEHNHIDHYDGPEDAAARLAAIAADALAAIATLRGARRHRAILDGVAAFYLSHPAAEAPFALPARRALLATLGPGVAPLAGFARLRRRV